MKSQILQALILAPLLVASASSACVKTKVNKTLAWNYVVYGGQSNINYFNLTSPGRGYAWRERVYNAVDWEYDVTRAILLENDQNWRLINCTAYFPPGAAARQGCTSPDLALLAPAGGGKLGALGPEDVWAVYELREFRITPIADDALGDVVGDVEGEVQGWKEDGGTVSMQFHIRGVQPGYRVTMSGGRWDSIVQWQVKLRNPRSYGEVGFVIDDVVIVEDAITPETCQNPTQTPTAPPEPVRTLRFDDLPTGPVPTAPYNGYNFLPPYQISQSPDAVSPPNVLSAFPNDTHPHRLLGKSFLFDTRSFHLIIRSSLPPTSLSVTIWGYGPCYNAFVGGGITAGSFKEFTPPSLAFRVDITSWGFEKDRALDLAVRETASGLEVPFEVDNLALRSWGEGPSGLGLPGCQRCGKNLIFFCEYPAMSRNAV